MDDPRSDDGDERDGEDDMGDEVPEALVGTFMQTNLRTRFIYRASRRACNEGEVGY